MDFSEKLNFLLNITDTSNKELAIGISVDPSLISLLKTGKRKQPTNNLHIRNMANFFTGIINSSYQINALREVIDNPAITLNLPDEIMTQYLYNWLSDDKVTSFNINNTSPENLILSNKISDFPQSMTNEFFFNLEGREEALLRFVRYIDTLETSEDLYILSDDNFDLSYDNIAYIRKFNNTMISAIDKGLRIKQIMPSLNCVTKSGIFKDFWIPVYSKGHVSSFYYPKFKDNITIRNLYVIPNHIACVSTTISSNCQNYITMLSTDKKIVETYTRQFEEYVKLCKPVTKSIHDFNIFKKTINNCYETIGNAINVTGEIPMHTMDSRLIKKLMDRAQTKIKMEFLEQCLDLSDKFNSKLKSNDSVIDIFYLPKPDEAFERMQLNSYSSFAKEIYGMCRYQEYRDHLINIRKLLLENDNYYVVLLSTDKDLKHNFFINENGFFTIINREGEITLTRILCPEIFELMVEEAKTIAFKYGFKGKHKTDYISVIEEYIDLADKLITPPACDRKQLFIKKCTELCAFINHFLIISF